MRRDVFSPDHELYRSEFRRYAKTEVEPKVAEWNAHGISDRESWRKIGRAGYLGASMPEQYGGAGGDFLHEAIVIEELALLRAHALQTSLHTGICMPYLLHYGSEAQRQRFLRPAINGDCLLAIAMTEPSAGSDLAGR
jgi:acyl-CoA dehydrogenase